MASVRNLKKSIQAVTSELLTDAILLSLFIEKDKMAELSELAADLNELEVQMTKRARKPRENKEPAKQYYAKLRGELQEQWCQISEKLKALSEHIKEEE